MRKIWRNTLAIILVSPVVYLLVLSLSQKWLFPKLIPDLSLSNWQKLFDGQSDLGSSLITSLLLSISIAFVATALAFVTSHYLFLSSKADLFKKLAILPFALSPIIFAIAISFYFNYFGISASVIGVGLAQLFIVYPYALLLFSGFWNAKHHDYKNLVATLGGSHLDQWRNALIPISKQMLLISFFQSFLISWFDFGLTQYIGIGKVKTLTIQVYSLVNEANPYVAAVAAMLLILPPLALLYINKLFILKNAS
ncbi:MAG: ABC transporter permease subunit [Bacteroidia bacterium]